MTDPIIVEQIVDAANAPAAVNHPYILSGIIDTTEGCISAIQDEEGNFSAIGENNTKLSFDLDAALVKAEELKVIYSTQFLREDRDRKLAETDWWVLPDRTPTQAQLDYRQALRDLPANTTDPTNPVWPVKPE